LDLTVYSHRIAGKNPEKPAQALETAARVEQTLPT